MSTFLSVQKTSFCYLRHPYFSHSIRTHCDELQCLWAELERAAADRGQKLHEASEGQQFYRAVNDLDLWLEEVEQQLLSDDVGKVNSGFLLVILKAAHLLHFLSLQDLAGVQKLQKRLGRLEMDISVHQEQIDSLSAQAQGFQDAGHFDSEAIRETQEAFVARYEGLQVRAISKTLWSHFTYNLLTGHSVFPPGTTQCTEISAEIVLPVAAVFP